MSKSIFMIDTPKSCEDCEFGQEVIVDNEMFTACTFKLYTRSMIMLKGCPLKPLPSKKTISEEMVWNTKYENKASYYSGYNACIDEILTMNEEIIKEDNENRY